MTLGEGEWETMGDISLREGLSHPVAESELRVVYRKQPAYLSWIHFFLVSCADVYFGCLR